ncbi:hypothetical protein [uncultured Fibrobacter sp.]|uniref:hypothetical protein n=1 Tax=uncultured Fibrobacter sp. TaxID=261512 RepID=UPI0025CC9A17|nr:hypothetical protein [uncultured Fibrobacter sp.]
MDLKELASLAGIGPKVIYKWQYMHKDSSRPDYNAVVRLLEKGATVETLFGVEYRGRSVPAEVSENPDFQAGVVKALADKKSRGIIREEVEQAIAEMKAKGQL